MFKKYKLLTIAIQDAERKIQQLENALNRMSSNFTDTANSQLKMNSFFLDNFKKIEKNLEKFNA